jgi:predicted small lipoprotein YifL
MLQFANYKTATRYAAIYTAVLLLIIALLTVACGQKGDLILPDDAKAQQEKKKKSRLF